MTILRLFSADGDDFVSAQSPVQDFFEGWYQAAAVETKRRKPPGELTIKRRGAAVAWWSRLMATQSRPFGPALDEITQDDLILFRQRLESAKFRRGKLGPLHPLSEMSQVRTLEEVIIVLAAAGPRSAGRIRAGFLDEPPAIYVERASQWPKETWQFEEAQQIATALNSITPGKAWGKDPNRYRDLARATIALWFYTGHRATTYGRLAWSNLIETKRGHYLQIRKSVKTSKQDRVAVHPQLLAALKACQGIDSTRIIKWPIAYRAVAKHHEDWQRAAGLDESRQFSPQAWRRLHGDAIAATGYESASRLAAQSLGHSSVAITEAHYTAARDAAILSLPNLFVAWT